MDAQTQAVSAAIPNAHQVAKPSGEHSSLYHESTVFARVSPLLLSCTKCGICSLRLYYFSTEKGSGRRRPRPLITRFYPFLGYLHSERSAVFVADCVCSYDTDPPMCHGTECLPVGHQRRIHQAPGVFHADDP